MEQLYTRWGENFNTAHVLEEYPRPLLVRNSYQNLNGYWDYAFTKKYKKPEHFEGKILVPFSPETVLSGVGRQLQPEEYLWYRRTFEIGEVDSVNGESDRERKEDYARHLLLHFGAVDQACRVWIDGTCVGGHTGGYLPFELDITDAIRAGNHTKNDSGKHEILVAVKDLSDTSYHARGKQKLKSGGMFYTAQSGIWQTVWMEWVPERYVQKIETVSDLERSAIRIRVGTGKETKGSFLPLKIKLHQPRIYREAEIYGRSAENPIGADRTEKKQTELEIEPEWLVETEGTTGEWIEISIDNPKLWTCEEPWLYYFDVTMGEDQVISYFAMRQFSLEKDEKDLPRICLNGKVQFQEGVLDQGYWPESLYTAPTDEAMIFDIQEMKKTGFNMIRKHLKIEPERWYYHCDRLGIVVWQDMVNGGGTYQHWFVTYLATLMSWCKIPMRDIYSGLLSRRKKAGRMEFVREMRETIELLKNHPCISTWVIFNEGWGQFQTEDLTKIVRSLDPTRLIDQASGWFDQGGGDFSSLHNYFFGLFIRPEKKRVSALTEYGGYSYREEGHCACPKSYGYGSTCKSKKELNQRYRKRRKQALELISKGLCATVYTQWTDVEEEVNGVYTYDREVRKIERADSTIERKEDDQ